MKTAQLSNLLGVPVNWLEPSSTKRDAMALITVTTDYKEKLAEINSEYDEEEKHFEELCIKYLNLFLKTDKIKYEDILTYI